MSYLKLPYICICIIIHIKKIAIYPFCDREVHVECDGRVLFLDPFRRHHDSEHAANVKITRKTVTRLHAARAIANTYFRFWVRINVLRLQRLHYHRFRGSLYNVSFVSGKRNLARCYFRNISGDPYITVNYAELKINFNT